MHATELIKKYKSGERNFRGADLRWADLRWADLRWADLPAPTMVLLANWGTVSDNLCINLMRYDCDAHNSPAMFDRWSQDGPCPYGDVKFQRACNFRENPKLWVPGRAPKVFSLMVRLLQEKCADSDYHAKK